MQATETSTVPESPGEVESPGPAKPRAAETYNLLPAHRTLSEPTRGWQLVNVSELWRYRELLFFLIWRDVKVRYKQTVLGVLWAFIQPAMLMVVFTFVFNRLGGLSSGDIPYPLFALSGLLAWTFFSSAVNQAGASVVGSERLISKIYFPRLIVPLASIGATVVDFAIALSLLAVLMIAYGVAPGWQIVLAPAVFAILLLTAVGIGTFLAALNVTYRDVKYVIPFLLQVGMYATPTIYMVVPDDASEKLRWLVDFNPLANLIEGFRACVLGGPIPWTGLGFSLIVAILVCVGGCLYFRKVEDNFADVI